MQKKETKNLIRHLIDLSHGVSQGIYSDTETLFELTNKNGGYPEEISELAESFGLMLVKVEAREFQLTQVLEELKEAHTELEQAHERLARENLGLKKSLGKQFAPKKIIGHSREMQNLLNQVDKVADTPVNVLITGETGTGKELIAKSLHFGSARNRGPFIALNCTAIPDNLLESELFGIEKGVATGVEKRIGRIEQAQHGTLFLDEIGDMSFSNQAKILRVLEERELHRVGGQKPIQVNIRLITATNKDLKLEVEEGRFREDLYYRIKVVELKIPPLRDRREDIPLLIKSFLQINMKRMDRHSLEFSPDAMECLKQYPWPGNARELENEVERAVALTTSDLIDQADLSHDIRNHFRCFAISSCLAGDNLHEVEKHHIRRVLADVQGNKTEGARRLGLSREGLRKKMKRYQIS